MDAGTGGSGGSTMETGGSDGSGGTSMETGGNDGSGGTTMETGATDASGGMVVSTGGVVAVQCQTGEWDHDADVTTACVPWSDCAAGTFVSAAGSEASDRVCAPCTDGEFSDVANAVSCTLFKTCAGGEYETTPGSKTADRECAPCASGTFSSGENAPACDPLTVCAAGEYESAAPTASSDRECTPCANGTFSSGENAPACAPFAVCVAGEYESAAPTASSDRECTPCANGTFSDTENATACTDWSAVCGQGYTQSVAPSAVQDRTCADVDECATQSPCIADGDTLASCTNEDGGYSCTCSTDSLARPGRCLPVQANCSQLFALDATIPSGVYTIDVDGAGGLDPMSAYCDMENEGGGWTLVANYVHKSGTTPLASWFGDHLPLLGPGVLGDDESGTTYWGHTDMALMTLIAPDELRFYGESSSHTRILHFSTTDALCIQHLKDSTTGCVAMGMNNNFTPLTGHTALLPAAATGFWNGTLNGAFLDHPFATSGADWAVGTGGGVTWAMDDGNKDEGVDTIHRLYVRHVVASTP